MRNGQIQKIKEMRKSEATTSGTHCPKRVCGSFHCGLVHKPVSIQEALKIPDAKAAVDKELEKEKTIPTWDVKKKGIKDRSYPSIEEGWENSSLRKFDGPLLKAPTHHQTRLSSCTPCFSHSAILTVEVKTLAFACSLCCSGFAAQTFLDSVGAVLSPRVLRRQYFGKGSRCVSVPHPYTALRAHSVVLWSETHTPVSQVKSSSTSQCLAEKY